MVSSICRLQPAQPETEVQCVDDAIFFLCELFFVFFFQCYIFFAVVCSTCLQLNEKLQQSVQNVAKECTKLNTNGISGS